MDSSQYKQHELASWTRVAGGWAKHTPAIGKLFGPVTERMFELVGLRERQRVLDIASGAGDPGIPAAQRVGRFGRVWGIDFVPAMVDFANERVRELDLGNVEFQLADGENFQVPGNIFDVCTMRWGLMFMPDPLAALNTARVALKEGGRIVLTCWAGPDRNPWAAIPMAHIKRYVDVPAPAPGATGIFAFADRDRILSVMREAGFRDVTVEAFDLTAADAATGQEYFTMVREIAGPVASLIAGLSAETQAKLSAEIALAAEQASTTPGRVTLPGVTWIATGTH